MPLVNYQRQTPLITICSFVAELNEALGYGEEEQKHKGEDDMQNEFT